MSEGREKQLLAGQAKETLQLISEQGDRIDERFKSLEERLALLDLIVQASRVLAESGASLREHSRQEELAEIRTAINQLGRNQQALTHMIASLERRIARAFGGTV